MFGLSTFSTFWRWVIRCSVIRCWVPIWRWVLFGVRSFHVGSFGVRSFSVGSFDVRSFGVPSFRRSVGESRNPREYGIRKCPNQVQYIADGVSEYLGHQTGRVVEEPNRLGRGGHHMPAPGTAGQHRPDSGRIPDAVGWKLNLGRQYVDLGQLISSPSFDKWKLEFQCWPRDIFIRRNMLTSAGVDVRATVYRMMHPSTMRWMRSSLQRSSSPGFRGWKTRGWTTRGWKTRDWKTRSRKQPPMDYWG